MREDDGKYIFSQTEIATYMRCENKHRYSYGLNLEVPPWSGSAAMQFGTACHFAFEHAYGYWYKRDWLDSAMQALENLQTRGFYMYKGVKQMLDKMTDADWSRARHVVFEYHQNMILGRDGYQETCEQQRATEVSHLSRIGGSNRYVETTFDMVIFGENGGGTEIMDHKFRARVTGDELLHMIPQNQIYAWAAREIYGESCDMVINTVMSKAPGRNPSAAYRRDRFFYSDEQLNMVGNIIENVCERIVRGSQTPQRTIITNGSDACLWCPYKQVCEQELSGYMSNAEISAALSGEESQTKDDEY